MTNKIKIVLVNGVVNSVYTDNPNVEVEILNIADSDLTTLKNYCDKVEKELTKASIQDAEVDEVLNTDGEKVKLFTHIDFDGVGCAIVASKFYGVGIDVTYCDYDEINSKVSEFIESGDYKNYKAIYITDISVNAQTALKIDALVRNEHSNWKLFDHHQTAMWLNSYPWAKVKIKNDDNKKTCGTELFYDYLYLDNTTLSKFVELVRSYDTWDWAYDKDNGTLAKQMNDLYYLYGRNTFVSNVLSKIDSPLYPYLDENEQFVLSIKQKEINDYIKKKEKSIRILEKYNYKIGVVFADKYFSELGNSLCNSHKELDFVAIIDMDGVIHFRSIKDNINLGEEIARLYGGGGHPKSASARISEEVMTDIMNKVFYIN